MGRDPVPRDEVSPDLDGPRRCPLGYTASVGYTPRSGAARHAKERIRTEVEALAADAEDRAESAEVLRDMESLRAR